MTDIARRRKGSKPSDIIRAWLKNSATIRFLEVWEGMNNPNFKLDQMGEFKQELLDDRNIITPKKYIEAIGAIGIVSTAGRYGGTYAHEDIALEFASWIEPAFKLFLITEFKRLKSEEAKLRKLEWSTSRFLSKRNYELQTHAIQENIIPRIDKSDQAFVYASEADLLNLALFGMTAKTWRESNPTQKGNIRDHAETEELLILSNLESFNAHLIKRGANKEARFAALCDMAEYEREIFINLKKILPPE